MRRRSGLVALLAVTGPGLLAGLSDDDPAGITTYSILGADYGYRLLWVLGLSTAALVLFDELGARMGVVTGQGMAGLIRERYGVRVAVPVLAALVLANVGTTCAEFAGVAAGMELAGVSRYVSVPIAAGLVSALVLKGGFHRVEHVLLVLATAFGAYIAAEFPPDPTGPPPRAGSPCRRCRSIAKPFSRSPRLSARRSHPGVSPSYSPTRSTSASRRRISVMSASTS